MTELAGSYFDGRSSRRREAVAHITHGLVSVRAGGEDLVPPTPLAQVTLSSRIGNTPRFLRFPGGASFETADNAAVDQAFADARPRTALAHRLESRLRYVLIGLVVTAGFVWGTLHWGIPALAEAAAHRLPPQIQRNMDTSVLKALDESLLRPSRLDEPEQQRLLSAFAPLLDETDPRFELRVLFRDAEHSIGANALALPAGTIIFTDQIVHLAEHDAELLGVLAHEIGHVVLRHGLRQTLQASAVGVLALLVVGDVSSVSGAVLALPLMLTELGYSRRFEREADRYAAEVMARHDIAATHLGNILLRMGGGGDDEGAAPEWSGYLSTHPPTRERMRALGGQ